MLGTTSPLEVVLNSWWDRVTWRDASPLLSFCQVSFTLPEMECTRSVEAFLAGMPQGSPMPSLSATPVCFPCSICCSLFFLSALCFLADLFLCFLSSLSATSHKFNGVQFQRLLIIAGWGGGRLCTTYTGYPWLKLATPALGPYIFTRLLLQAQLTPCSCSAAFKVVWWTGVSLFLNTVGEVQALAE